MTRSLMTAVSLLSVLLSASSVLAGDGATVVFRQGHVIVLDSGWKALSEAMKAPSGKPRVVEFNTGQGQFMIDASEVVTLCRDDCRIGVVDLRDPARTPAR